MLPIILLALESDDDRAFVTELYERHKSIMYKQALNILRSRDHVEDVVGDACLAIIDNILLIRTLDGYILRAYIVSIVRNTAINFIARRDRQRKRAYLAGDEHLSEVPSDEPDPLSELMWREQVERLMRAIDTLPEHEQGALRMKYLDDLGDVEIAAELGIKVNSVRPCLMRARRHALSAYNHMKER